jgi:antitoxin PrlF
MLFSDMQYGGKSMVRKRGKAVSGVEGKQTTASCCRVESLISVDERGQMVLPKELRDRAQIKAGDKLALITWEKDGEICCLTLIKADHLAFGVKEFLGPVMRDISGNT